jgi:sulfate transport system permease protein
VSVARDLTTRSGRIAAAGLTYVYFALVVLLPLGWLAWEGLQFGPGTLAEKLGHPHALRAFWLTGLIALLAALLNGAFGIALAIVFARHRFRGRRLANAFVDVPFAVSPIVAGLMILLVYGPQGILGLFFDDLGVQVVFALPGMVLATVFATFPFVVRELTPVLEQAGTEMEEAARTLGASPWTVFRRVTLPTIRWALAYGVMLTVARSLGEFGAVLVVSGNIVGKTQTAPLYVYQAYADFDMPTAYAASLVLILLAVVMLAMLGLWKRRRNRAEHRGA